MIFHTNIHLKRFLGNDFKTHTQKKTSSKKVKNIFFRIEIESPKYD